MLGEHILLELRHIRGPVCMAVYRCLEVWDNDSLSSSCCCCHFYPFRLRAGPTKLI